MKTMKKHLIKFLKDGGHYSAGDQRRSLSYLIQKASHACYWTPDCVDRSKIAKVVCLARAAHLEAVAKRREGLPDFARDVAYRHRRASEYRRMAETGCISDLLPITHEAA